MEIFWVKYLFFKLFIERDLVYYENFFNFCEFNLEMGFFGIRDWICNVIFYGIDGCDLFCCGCGYNMRMEKWKEKCYCIFYWCCYVSC